MNATEIIMRFVVGGSLVSAVTLLTRTKYYTLSGVILLFPAVTLIGLYFIGTTVDTSQLKQITRFSMYALAPTFIFLCTFYYAQSYVSVPLALIASVCAWIVSAIIIVVATNA